MQPAQSVKEITARVRRFDSLQEEDGEFYTGRLNNYRGWVAVEEDNKWFFAPDIWAAFLDTDKAHFQKNEEYRKRKAKVTSVFRNCNFFQLAENDNNEYQQLITVLSQICLDKYLQPSFWHQLPREQIEEIINNKKNFPLGSPSIKFWVHSKNPATNLNKMRVRDVTDKIKFTDQIYGLGHRITPIMSFPRGNYRKTTYNNIALKEIDWEKDYTAQYIPKNTPKEEEKENAGKIVSLVSVYPKIGSTREFITQESWDKYDMSRWPDAIMLREVFYFAEPPVLKEIYDNYKSITSYARGKLGKPTEDLYNALADLEIYPVLDLYRSPLALEYLKSVEKNPKMQIVANRRTGKAGYVYALSLPAYPGLLKIGSAFDVGSRISSLSTSVPENFEIKASYFSENCRELEQVLHQKLSGCRERREWFQCTVEEFQSALKCLT